MAEKNIQVNKEQNWLDATESDPSTWNVRELRHRSVNEESHMPPLDSHPQAQFMCMCNPKLQSY